MFGRFVFIVFFLLLFASVSGESPNLRDKIIENAKSGNAFSQSTLGDLNYCDFLAGDKNAIVEAIKWYKMASDAGIPRAQYRLGMIYLNGDGVEKDIITAASLIKKSALANRAYALAQLGRMYQSGLGVDRSISEAIRYYRLAIKEDNDGSESAEYSLALLYADGLGVPKDEKVAIKLMTDAANRGHMEACEAIELYDLRKQAKSGNIECAVKLGKRLLQGEGVNYSPKEAVVWLKRASDSHNAEAMYLLGNIYISGKMVKKNTSMGIRLLVKSASAGNRESQELVKFLREKHELTKNIEAAESDLERGFKRQRELVLESVVRVGWEAASNLEELNRKIWLMNQNGFRDERQREVNHILTERVQPSLNRWWSLLAKYTSLGGDNWTLSLRIKPIVESMNRTKARYAVR